MEDNSNDQESEVVIAADVTGPTKRPRSSPTRLTPRQCQKRVPLREIAAADSELTQFLEPRRLSYHGTHNHSEKWATAEIRALVEFILFHTTGDVWPAHKQQVFWSNAAEYVRTRSASSVSRSGTLFI